MKSIFHSKTQDTEVENKILSGILYNHETDPIDSNIPVLKYQAYGMITFPVSLILR